MNYKFKVLVDVIAVAFGVSFLDGMLGWDLADGFYILVGLVEIVCIIWLLVLIHKKNDN